MRRIRSARPARRLGAAWIGLAVLAVLSVLAPSASALVVHSARGRSFGVTLHRDTTATSVPGSVAAAHAAQLSRQVAGQPGGDTGTLTWHNGPVIHSSTPYLVFWTPSGESIDPSTQGLLSHYFTDVAADSTQASNVYAVARQYYDQSGFADYRQSFDPGTQVITDTAPYPSPDPSGACGGSIAATCLSDGQLSAELARLVAADGLPDDGASSSELPGGAPVYVIVLPSDVDVCLTSSVCASTTFCSYHSGSASPPYLLYAAIPLYPVLQDPKACQFDGQTAVQEPNQSVADVALRNLSHEQVEMVTDPMFTGWWDPLSGNEQADNCNAYGPFDPANGTNPDAFTPVLGGDPSLGTAYNQVINGDHYYLQSEWSNGDSACDMAPAPATLAPSFSVPAGPLTPGSTVSFHPSASTSANPLTSVTWNFGDGTTSFTNGSTLAAVQHTYATAGDYTVTLTVVDSSGNLAATTSVVSVGAAVTAGEAPPAATVATVRAPLLPSATTRGLTAADQPPVPGFAVTTAKPASGQPVHFSASASRATHGWIAAYRWSFGDGATSSGGAPSHTYARPGTYIVSLTVTDNRGASAGTARALAVALSGRITKVALSGGRTGAMMLAVSVDTAGTLTVGRRRFRLRHAGMARVLVNLTAAQRRSLRRTHKLRLRLTLRFAPAAGALSTGRSR